MATKELPSPDTLRQLLRYEPETGKLFWREREPAMFEAGRHSAERSATAWNSRYAGKVAFTALEGEGGYQRGRIYGQLYKAHRVAWTIFYGCWPEHEIDHIDGDKSNNRITNLRDVPHMLNCRNRRLQKTNTTGYSGLTWRRDTKKWRACIHVNGRPTTIGSFATKEEAIDARKRAQNEQGYHPNHGT